MADGLTKQEIVNKALQELGLPKLALSTGSTIPKAFFRGVADALGLALDEALSMPEMGRAMVESAGLHWGADCDSTETPSGGGSTVTRTGLERILDAVRIHGHGVSHPEIADEVQDAALAVARVAGRGRGQGFQQTAAIRVAIENYAMARAKEFFEAGGWACEDVHSYRSYDFHCTRGEDVLHIEVKGTTSAGEEVILTPGEVRLARGSHPQTALFVMCEVVVSTKEGPAPSVQGGRHTIVQPWYPDEGDLRPLGFRYSLPESED